MEEQPIITTRTIVVFGAVTWLSRSSPTDKMDPPLPRTAPCCILWGDSRLTVFPDRLYKHGASADAIRTDGELPMAPLVLIYGSPEALQPESNLDHSHFLIDDLIDR